MKKDPIQYWLLKSEADCYSILDLKKDKKVAWTDVRNFQARNFLRSMKKNDVCIFYHSNKTPPGAAGIARVVKVAYPDPTQFDKKSEFFDPKATKEKSIWDCVDISFVKKFNKEISINEMRIDPALQSMIILQKGSRLSVTPLSEREASRLISLGS